VEFARSQQAVYIHPFDDPIVWSGHASMIREIAEEGIRPGAIVASVGGGGLLCGLVEGMHAMGWTDIPVVAVETEGAASFAASVQAGRLVTLDRITSTAFWSNQPVAHPWPPDMSAPRRWRADHLW
jgi:L-serine/L-threonine ammonia-lyase